MRTLTKSLASFLAITLLVVLTNCSKKDEPAAPSIAGTWLQTLTSTTGCTDPGNNVASASCGVDCFTLVITGSNTYSTSGGSPGTTSGTWSTGGLPLTDATGAIVVNQTAPTPDDPLSFTFTMNATTLTLAAQDINTNCTTTLTFSRQ